MTEKGFDERDVFSKGLWLVQQATQTRRLALLDSKGQIESFLSIQSPSEISQGLGDEPQLLSNEVERRMEEFRKQAENVVIKAKKTFAKRLSTPPKPEQEGES